MVASLEKLCNVQVAILLCNHEEVKRLIFYGPVCTKSSFSYAYEVKQANQIWSTPIVSEATKILNEYSPLLVRLTTVQLVPLIGIKIRNWAKLLESFGLTLEFCHDFIKPLFFTSRGTIKEVEAAREIVKESRVTTFLKLKIACYYFLEDLIPILWEQSCENENDFKEFLHKHPQHEPVVLWSKYLDIKNKLILSKRLNSLKNRFLLDVFSSAITMRNVAGLNYCWKTQSTLRKILSYTEHERAEIEGISYISIYTRNWANLYLPYRITPFCSDFKSCYFNISNLLEFFLPKMNNEEIKELVCKSGSKYHMLKLLLYWPYCDLFMVAVNSVLSCLGYNSFCHLLFDIVTLIKDPNFNQTCDYRLLVSNLLNKFPSHLKEIAQDVNIFAELITIKNFTSVDENNFLLLLEHTTLDIPKTLFFILRKIFCRFLSRGNFRFANSILDCLNLDKEIIDNLKKDLIFDYFLVVMENESIGMANSFVNWVVSSDKIDQFKTEIFLQMFQFDHVTSLVMNCAISVAFLDKIMKWFLHTDQQIKEWKLKGVFDEKFSSPSAYDRSLTDDVTPFHRNMKGFEQFLEWFGYPEDKKEIPALALPHLVLRLVRVCKGSNLNKYFKIRIKKLCLRNKERRITFIKALQSWSEDYVKHNKCIFCRTSSNVCLSHDVSTSYCNLHVSDIFSIEDIDLFCSSLENLESENICDRSSQSQENVKGCAKRIRESRNIRIDKKRKC